MLSTNDLEKLIAVKKQEIQKEKSLLGLAETQVTKPEEINGNPRKNVNQKSVKISEDKRVIERDDASPEDKKEAENKSLYELEEEIPPDLERYIRRYLGLPVMLKAGEYSPNNPLIRGERTSGDALLGLGEYERRRNTLRKIRQQQYREYLDQQAKKKQEAKEQAERERREREEKERVREESERVRLRQERENSPKRRASVNCLPKAYNSKIDTGVQVNSITNPLSVAVQTDDTELYQLSPTSVCKLTEAERELSPRTVHDYLPDYTWKEPCPRRRSYGDFDERFSRSNRDKLVNDLRHTYMPSIFDADAIQQRNIQAEKEAAERRQYYRQELKNQIQEQQRIKEERKNREKLLEQAEMRRLEEQLRMLRTAQEKEMNRQHDINIAMKQSTDEYNNKIAKLQNDIDIEKQNLALAKRNTVTSRSDTQTRSVYPVEKKPYSTNIPVTSIFSQNYDVDAYLRRNLNFEDNYSRGSNESIIGKKSETPKDHFDIDFQLKSKKIVNRKIEDNSNDLPIPVLKHVSKIDSEDKIDNVSDAMKRVEAKWQVPAVQKNILKSMPNSEGKNISILTQLGSIRRQLQLEQLRLDEKVNKEV